MSQLPERPPLFIAIETTEGTERIHMTYGLFSDLQRVCPDVETLIASGLSDAYARDYIIRRCLTKSKKMITNEADLVQPEDMTLDDPAEMEKLLTWVSGHLMYFFASSAEGLKKLGQVFSQLTNSTPVEPSKTGSETSA